MLARFEDHRWIGGRAAERQQYDARYRRSLRDSNRGSDYFPVLVLVAAVIIPSGETLGSRRRAPLLVPNPCQSLVTVWWTPSSKFCHRTLTCGFTVTLAG